MPDDSGDPIRPNKEAVNDGEGLWAIFRANLQRPPDRRLGRNAIAGAVLVGALGIGLWLTGQPGDGRMGPWAKTLVPLYFLLLALAALLSGLSDLRPATDRPGIVRLRMLSTVMRIAAFAVWGTGVVSLYVT
jgi:hypothetical protein